MDDPGPGVVLERELSVSEMVLSLSVTETVVAEEGAGDGVADGSRGTFLMSIIFLTLNTLSDAVFEVSLDVSLLILLETEDEVNVGGAPVLCGGNVLYPLDFRMSLILL